MDELIRQITAKTGIAEDQARTAINTVTGFLKDKLPAPIGGQIDNVINGAGGVGDALGDTVGDIASKVGGMFGK